MKRFMTMAAAVVLAAPAAWAGPFQKAQVPASAVWVAHVDVQSLLRSELGKAALAEARKQEAFNNGLAWIQQAFGFNPLMDLRGVTLYGQQLGDEIGVVILDALLSQDKIVPMLQGNETYKSRQYGKHTVHEWRDAPKPVRDPASGEVTSYVPGKRQIACFYDANLVVVANSPDGMEKALDVLDGKGESLAKTPMPALPAPAKGAFLVAAAGSIELPGPVAAKPEAALLRQIQGAALQAGEVEGQLFVNLTGVLKTAQRAEKVREIVQGLVALGQVMMEERPDIPALGEKVDVASEGTKVHLHVAAPSEAVIKLARFLLGQAQAGKAKAGGGEF